MPASTVLAARTDGQLRDRRATESVFARVASTFLRASVPPHGRGADPEARITAQYAEMVQSCSLRRNPGRPDQLAPRIDLALEKSAGGRECPDIGLIAEPAQALVHGRLGDDVVHRRVQLHADIVGR